MLQGFKFVIIHHIFCICHSTLLFDWNQLRYIRYSFRFFLVNFSSFSFCILCLINLFEKLFMKISIKKRLIFDYFGFLYFAFKWEAWFTTYVVLILPIRYNLLSFWFNKKLLILVIWCHAKISFNLIWLWCKLYLTYTQGTAEVHGHIFCKLIKNRFQYVYLVAIFHNGM